MISLLQNFAGTLRNSRLIDCKNVYLICVTYWLVQCSPFISLCLGSIKANHVISEPCYRETIRPEAHGPQWLT